LSLSLSALAFCCLFGLRASASLLIELFGYFLHSPFFFSSTVVRILILLTTASFLSVRSDACASILRLLHAVFCDAVSFILRV